MRITHYRTMTDDELLNFAATRAETPLEIELMNRLNAKMYGATTPSDNSWQMQLAFGETRK